MNNQLALNKSQSLIYEYNFGITQKLKLLELLKDNPIKEDLLKELLDIVSEKILENDNHLNELIDKQEEHYKKRMRPVERMEGKISDLEEERDDLEIKVKSLELTNSDLNKKITELTAQIEKLAS